MTIVVFRAGRRHCLSPSESVSTRAQPASQPAWLTGAELLFLHINTENWTRSVHVSLWGQQNLTWLSEKISKIYYFIYTSNSRNANYADENFLLLTDVFFFLQKLSDSVMEFYHTILLLCSTLIFTVDSLMFHLEANARFDRIEESPVNCNVDNVQECPDGSSQPFQWTCSVIGTNSCLALSSQKCL